MVANGGQDILTRDGKLHTDDPKVREAAIRSVEFMTNCYKEGYIPPEALTWNDADDNNAYHEKLFVMDLDGTLSTELAMIKNKKAYYEEAVVMGLPNRNDGSTDALLPRRRRRLHPEGREERRGVQGFHEVSSCSRR